MKNTSELSMGRGTPFLRWAGGKKWLIKHLEIIIGQQKFNNYHEPFIGGGALFFAINPSNKIYLSDMNSELIETYKAIKKFPNDIFDEIMTYENSEEFYYEIRRLEPIDEIKKAARFIFLNQTSYNGIYRVNKNGKYNVPYGFRKNIQFERKKIIGASKALKNAHLNIGDFTKCKAKIQRGDLVFLDPPYTVSHNKNGFIEYNKRLFSLDDQYRLSKYIDYLKEKEAFYILTNAAHEKVFEIFNKNDRLLELERNSLIGGKDSKRGLISEYVFTNIFEEVTK